MTISTPYYIDYVILKDNNGLITGAYFQLTRTNDDAILYANENLDNIFLHCFHAGINKDQIVIL